MAAPIPKTDSSPTRPTNDLPEQLHAGKVGYGPNFARGPTIGDKFKGLEEQALGKLTQNKERVDHGKKISSGEVRRKEQTGEDEPNPFESAEPDDSKQGEENSTDSPDTSSNTSVDQGANETTKERDVTVVQPKMIDTDREQT